MKEEEVLVFIRATLKSVWALELLLLMRCDRNRAWTMGEIVRELRASTLVVSEALEGLRNAGLIAVDDSELICYRPATDHLDDFVAGVQELYLAKPLSVINAIATAPNEKLRIFAESFRLKD